MNIKYSAGIDINGNVKNVIVNHTTCEYRRNDVFLPVDIEVHINRTDLKALLVTLAHWHYTEV